MRNKNLSIAAKNKPKTEYKQITCFPEQRFVPIEEDIRVVEKYSGA